MRAGRYVAGATAALALIAALLVVGCVPPPTYQYQYVWHDVPGDWRLVGGHHGPAWGRDRDGAVIVIRWGEGVAEYGGSLYTIRDDGTNLTLLSPSPGDGGLLGGDRLAYDASPAVSRDGSRVAYATLRDSDEAGEFGIATVDVEERGGLLFFGGGRERRQLTPTDREVDMEPSWSPDGSRIAFLRDGRLHTMAPDGADVRSLAPDIEAVREPPAWSPDGTRLAFRRWDRAGGATELYVMGADGSNLTLVATGLPDAGRPNRGPAWSPDGRHLAYVRSEGPRFADTLVLRDIERRSVTSLARGQIGRVAWSPDGRELLYDSSLSRGGVWFGRHELFTVSVDAERRIREILGSDALRQLGLESVGPYRLEFAWSPDGGSIAVLVLREHQGPGRGYNPPPPDYGPGYVLLFTVTTDGSDLRVLLRVTSDGDLVTGSDAGR